MDTYVTKNQKKLRCGVTTGTCAAVCAKAAALKLLLGCNVDDISLMTPKGIEVRLDVTCLGADKNYAEFSCVKDSGDDPDVTNGTSIAVRIEYINANNVEATKDLSSCFKCENHPWLFLDGGTGIGRVTKAGLEQQIGCAAINKVPREMIFQTVADVCAAAEYREPLLITVSAPEGERLAERTFNPKLGIEGGISILGTSGIIEPMSEKAIIDTIEAEIRQRKALEAKSLIICPGNYGQSYMEKYLGLSIADSIKCSNYLGETFDLAVAYGIERVLLVGNVGKLVKLAAGIMNTHSRTADGRWEIFAAHSALCGADRETIVRISECINTEEMLKILDEKGLKQAVMKSICARITEHLNFRSDFRCRLGAMLFSENYGFVGQTENAEYILDIIRKEK
jgi:cobalt-precorrin-5B (C1)-methyltransferase